MKSFTQTVREGEIKGPQQHGFDLNIWNNAFSQQGKGNAEDEELHASGIWFHQQLLQLRSITNDASTAFQWSSTRDRLCAFVGYATLQWRNILAFTEKKLKNAENKPTFMSELRKVQVSSPFFAEADPAGAVESLVDGLRFPLSLDFEQSPLSIPFGDGGIEELNAFIQLTLVGQHYDLLTQRWLDCLWNDYRVLSNSEMTRIEPRSTEQAAHQAISAFRHESLLHESSYRAFSLWKHSLSDEAKRQHLGRRRLLSVYRRGDRFRVKDVPATRFPEMGGLLGFFRLAVTPAYTDSLLEVKFPALKGLTVAQVMEAYDLLSQFPGQIGHFLPSVRGLITSPEEFPRWAPLFSRAELVGAFKNALSIDASSAEWLLSKMTFTRSVREELWFQPFVPIAKDELALVTPAVEGVNFARLLDWLLRSTQEADAQIGPRFERYIHRELLDVAPKSKLASMMCVSPKPKINFHTADADEEIDLAFMLGNKLFICELKSNRFPCEPLEHLNYRLKLDEATKQASRKADLVRSNLESFFAQADFPQRYPWNKIAVHPLVISASQLFSGWEWKGVPVCDWFILRRFLVEGELELLAQSTETGMLEAGFVRKFYTSSEEAVETVFQYFCHAPQVHILEPFVKTVDRPLTKINITDTPTVLVNVSVQLPHDNLRALLAGMPKTT